jgi:hypothetical protein
MKFHLAGIIPVSGQKLDYNMPWHDSLMPIGPDYLAVERCVVECAYAGCETIWIVCADDTQPLIRYRIGEIVQDPVWILRRFEVEKREFQKPIQIYYVPIHPKDVNKRDCLSWSVLHGASIAKKISSKMSKWLIPDKFYVSWPYGYYDPSFLREYRDIISSKKDIYLTSNNRNVSNGEYLGFTFGLDTLEILKQEVHTKSTGFWTNIISREKLPIEERFSYRFFTLEQVFNSLNFSDVVSIEVNDYFKIDSWNSYCEFISQNGREVKRPSHHILKYKEWSGVGVNETID